VSTPRPCRPVLTDGGVVTLDGLVALGDGGVEGFLDGGAAGDAVFVASSTCWRICGITPDTAPWPCSWWAGRPTNEP
ncbi:MAG TPA: hypothetical protein VNT60_07415, partial [Deinococcales bacterium]|nr:hypothetical protein [Deinococcales bacterium]